MLIVSLQVQATYTGPQTSELAESMRTCDPDGPLMVQVAKLYHTTDAQSFRAFGRIISGTLRKGQELKVLGEGYSPEDEEDMMVATVEDIWVSGARLVYVPSPRMRLITTFLGISSLLMKSWLVTLSSLEASMPQYRRPPPLLP